MFYSISIAQGIISNLLKCIFSQIRIVKSLTNPLYELIHLRKLKNVTRMKSIPSSSSISEKKVELHTIQGDSGHIIFSVEKNNTVVRHWTSSD